MAWVISKIIGDGLTPDTAFRTAAQQYGLRILNDDPIPVDPKTGVPVSEFALIEIPDGDETHLKDEMGCFVVPKVLDKQALTKALTGQGCVVEVAALTTPNDLVAAVQAKVVTDKAAKK